MSRSHSHGLVTATAVVGLLARVAAQGDVHVVAPAPGPGVDFTSVQAAITAAADGDTILVRAGSYPGFTLTGKSLALTADTGADVHVGGSDYIGGLAAGQFVSVRGFTFDGDSGQAALSLESDAGTVWIEDCTLHGGEVGTLFGSPGSALRLQDCASVTLVHCQLTAGSLGVADALSASSSTVHVYGSTLTGGSGTCDFVNHFCPTAGAAAQLSSSFLTAQGSTFTGGLSGPGIQLGPTCSIFECVPSWGGSGLRWSGTAAPSTAFLFSSALLPGPALGTCCSFQGQSIDSSAGTGTATLVDGATLGMALGSPLREHQAGSFVFTGTAGDLVSLHVALLPGDLFKASLGGPWLLSGLDLVPLFAVVPAGGVLNVPFVVPSLPAGTESLAAVLQAARVSAAGAKLLAEPARAVLLDASF